MEKRGLKDYLLLGLLVIFIVAVGYQEIQQSESNEITGASIVGQKKCLPPKSALHFIQTKECRRIFEDPECQARGKVEIQC